MDGRRERGVSERLEATGFRGECGDHDAGPRARVNWRAGWAGMETFVFLSMSYSVRHAASACRAVIVVEWRRRFCFPPSRLRRRRRTLPCTDIYIYATVVAGYGTGAGAAPWDSSVGSVRPSTHPRPCYFLPPRRLRSSLPLALLDRTVAHVSSLLPPLRAGAE